MNQVCCTELVRVSNRSRGGGENLDFGGDVWVVLTKKKKISEHFMQRNRNEVKKDAFLLSAAKCNRSVGER